MTSLGQGAVIDFDILSSQDPFSVVWLPFSHNSADKARRERGFERVERRKFGPVSISLRICGKIEAKVRQRMKAMKLQNQKGPRISFLAIQRNGNM